MPSTEDNKKVVLFFKKDVDKSTLYTILHELEVVGIDFDEDLTEINCFTVRCKDFFWGQDFVSIMFSNGEQCLINNDYLIMVRH